MKNDCDPMICNASSLRKASRRVSHFYDLILAPSGLKCSQYAILSNLERMGLPNVLELASALVLDRTALTHNLRPLMRDGFVELLPDKFDKRFRRVRLTSIGIEKLNDCRLLWQIAQNKFQKAYGQEKSQNLRFSLFEIVSDEFLEKLENF